MELRNCTLPTGEIRTIRVQDGKIVEITEDVGWSHYVDLNRLTVIPGLIDVHVHSRYSPEHGSEGQAEDWEHLSAAALAGGVVMVADMPNTDPAVSSIDAFMRREEKIAKDPKKRIPHLTWFGATPNNARDIRELACEHDIAGVKMYMGSSTGDLLVADQHDQYRVMETCAELGLTCAVHAEDHRLMEQNMGKLRVQHQSLLTDHCLVRDTSVELSAVKRALRMAAETRCRIHLCHVSTPESLQEVRDAKDAGLSVTAGVCMHHVLLDKEVMTHAGGTNSVGMFKMNPPLRTAEQCMQLSHMLRSGDGYVDVVESDHAPHDHKAKVGRDRTLDNTPSGVPGVQTTLPLLASMTQSSEQAKLPITRLVELTSTNPAWLLGLADRKGKIEPGYDADIVALNPEQEFEIHHSDMKSRCRWTPFFLRRASGAPQFVIADGKVLLSNM